MRLCLRGKLPTSVCLQQLLYRSRSSYPSTTNDVNINQSMYDSHNTLATQNTITHDNLAQSSLSIDQPSTQTNVNQSNIAGDQKSSQLNDSSSYTRRSIVDNSLDSTENPQKDSNKTERSICNTLKTMRTTPA
ncbi:hypothetical protein PHSY_005877 [Pseudozyma hubeiensis SY62]|uniref:Uncharacterized protein n=1 Tax=Pseudozyma hubeiensis (strain SY62) TaxID=1305764 RepID=R9PAB2_PSEHS|nr:hypothetical protein PHSY_005877 [Pseudozyma hubeiensis SY62]GAC98284.1 hypothetical protein PHSY_005877 [Pseudozyma hubeiensis SY62]